MKKIYVSIILILILTLSNQKLSSIEPNALMGDFGIVGALGYNITATIEIVSVPFEGITEPKDSFNVPINRVLEIQNGIYWRFFMPGETTIQNNMAYMTKTANIEGNIFDIGHCSGGEFPLPNDNLSWGYAKYKITILVAETNEKYQLYINSLDSKYGRVKTEGYGRDLFIAYYPNNPLNKKVVFSKKHATNNNLEVIDTIATWDTLSNGKPSKEFKLWKVILGQDNPMEKNFFARTTPFPISPSIIYDNRIRELELGTKVIFDTVYNYTGLADKYGYNTIDSAQRYFPYFTNPPIPSGNSQKNTFITPAYFYIDDNSEVVMGMKINVLPGDTIILKPDKRLWISGYDPYSNNGDTLVLSAGSVITIETEAQLNTCRGGTILDYGATVNWAPNSFSHIFYQSELSYFGASHTINNGGHIEIDGYARLKVGNNTTVTFDGAGTYLKLNPNAIVQLGQNAKIVFKNGAYIKADNASFSGLNGATWEGIVFENAGSANEIKNCTFHNAKASLKFDNNTYGEFSKAEIINNTFNIPAGGNTYGVYGNNIFNLNIKDNRFYNESFNAANTNVGVYLKSSYKPGPPPEEDALPYTITIQYNLFRGGKAGIILANYASEYIPYSIYYNNFNDSSSYFSDYGIIGRKIDGDIKHCIFYPGKFNHNINVTQSNIRVGYSFLNSNYYNFYLNNSSYLDIGGTESDGFNVYFGGQNNLSSINNTNIYLSYFQNINLQYGRNCFLNYGGYGYYNLNGGIKDTSLTLSAEDNYWNNGTPFYSLVNYNNVNMTVNYLPVYDCNSTTGLQIYQVVNKGNGLIDTIYKLSNNNSVLNPETNYYLQAQQNANNFNYPTSIINQKALINQFPTGMYLPYVLNDLYLNYEKLDTSSNQGYRDNLYSDLKNYLNEKINSGLYDYQFNDLAYQIILMCEGNMQNYNAALRGFEFIAMYHPDAVTRLLASWDYVEIDALLNGMGGGSKENLSEKIFLKKEMKRLDKEIKKDSILTTLKRNYDKINKVQNKEIKADLNSKNKEVYEKAVFKKEKDDKIIRKSLTVLMGSKSMTSELKAEKQLEDILLISSANSEKKDKEGNASLPGNYNLSQNYPNPFNPVTKINFALPKQGFVTLKIYDIIGREIKTLVNEVKQAGYYTVDFNGSSLASGVYFYRIQSGDFISVKRMVLVK